MPTECGTILRKKRYSKGDSTVVSLLKSSGAYVMGKTVTTEFAYFDPGKTTNPHDYNCLLYTSPSPRDQRGSGMAASA